MIFVNGQMPGPNLIFDEDDDAEVQVRYSIFCSLRLRWSISQMTVCNDLPQNATVHFHGIAYVYEPSSCDNVG